METVPHTPHWLATRRTLSGIAALAVGTALFLAGGTASATVTIPADPGAEPAPVDPSTGAKRKTVKQIARREVKRRVIERAGDNVPRYRNGRGKIAPYGFQRGPGGPWCAAFATWTWGRAGFDDFRSGPVTRRAQLLRTSFSGESVAVQVADLRRWAKRTNRWTLYATPGDLVGYGDRHVGIVMQVDRNKRAILAIEGNLSNRVRWFRIPMTEVIDYFSPAPIVAAERASRRLMRPDVG
ncbi:MAG: hypothetical protein ACO3ZZ_08030 [Solirubrobacterales bacterium]|jgi:hypothetical protein